MKREIYQELLIWKNNAKRKPLIVKGARQTGKTWILNKFGHDEFKKIHYLNFQRSKNLCRIFEDDLSPKKIVSNIEFELDTSINIFEDIIFFDEIQDCSRAITSLKYFYEELPQLALVCAGSLLGVVHSDSAFPVGKVSFLNLYPLTFGEFLLALGDIKSFKIVMKVNIESKIPEIVHYHLLDRLKEYMITGGMPEVILVYIENMVDKYHAFNLVRDKQRELINSYMGDFSKYSGKINSTEIVSVFESIPSHLSQSNKKFVSSKVIQGGRFSRLRSSIDWLVGAGLVIKVKITNSGELPFAAFSKDNNFKLYFFDIGLLGTLGNISPKVIYMQNNLFATFKGAFCENFVAQEFICKDQIQLYCWINNTSEVEFVRDFDGVVIPVEVKAGLSGKLKSLNIFSQKYKSIYRLRLSSRQLEINNAAMMHSYPLYLAGRVPLDSK